jgi:uncharacterized protein YbjT (DUF2867 family)
VKVLLFGATGMVGQGVLRECLLAPDVERVLAVGRSATGQRHAKLEELLAENLYDLSPHAARLAGFDACFFCLGVSSAGMAEPAYRRITKDLTLSVARLLAPLSPGMTFIYVSGAGTDSTERGRSMWARVKGETENALLALPFKAVYLFRPAYIQPVHGARSRTRWTNVLYGALGPLFPVWKAFFPRWVTTTERVGKAMLAAARGRAPRPVLEPPDVDALGAG